MSKAVIERKTKETDIKLSLSLYEKLENKIDTGIGFLDHMLELMTYHSGIGLNIQCKGDLHIDSHHSTEDIGIAIGKAINQALGNRVGIARYGHMLLPMDEALAEVIMDISGRGMLVFNAEFSREKVGTFATEEVEEFFRAVAVNAGITLHIRCIYGKNTHHIIEAIFKGFGRAFKKAIEVVGNDIPSTKGVIDA